MAEETFPQGSRPEAEPPLLKAPLPLPALPAGARRLAPPASRIRRVALGFYGIVTLFAVGYALFSGNIKLLFGEREPTLVGLLGALGLAVGLVALWRMGVRLWKPVASATDDLEALIGPIGVGDAILLAVLSGFAEELLFRGALWPHLDLVGSALLFGLVHVMPRRSLWIYPLFAVLAGFLLGLLRAGTGSVLPAMLCHAVVNGLNLAWLGARARKAVLPAPPPA